MIETIKKLVIVQIVTLMIGLGALYLAWQSDKTARVNARQDSCRLIVGLANTATPANKKAAEQAYIAKTPLHDCYTYARGR